MIKKSHVKTRNTCKLTFIVPRAELPEDLEVRQLAVVGNFNDWDRTATPMKQNKDGSFKAEVEVAPGTEIQFRYLANDEHWFNAWEADFYTQNSLGADNCVVIAPASGTE